MGKYEDALERAKQGLPIDEVFPELKESEDERIRNEIIAFIEQAIHSGGGTIIPEEKEDKWIAYLEKQKEQQPAEWSEEDESCLEYALWCVTKTRYCVAKDACDFDACRCAERWLESLPERFNLQPKQEWSEEDEKVYTFIYDFFENCWWNKTWDISREQTLKILKSLRPQPHWKPSEEQMDALDNARFCKSYDRSELDLLYEQLKKL